MDVKRSVFDRFADIMDGNEQREFIYQILRSMELFFDVNVKKNMLWGEVPPFPTDLVSDESALVKDLYKVLYKHKKQKIQARNKEEKELRELGLLDDSSDDDDLLSKRRLSQVISADYFRRKHLSQSAVNDADAHYTGGKRRLSRAYFSAAEAGLK